MEGFCIVALPIGDAVVTYSDGDQAPLHQTLFFLGKAEDITPQETLAIIDLVKNFAAVTPRIESEVIGFGVLGQDREYVALTASWALLELRELLKDDETILHILARTSQHPGYVSHITGMISLIGGLFTFDRLAVWNGDSHYVFPLATDKPVAEIEEEN